MYKINKEIAKETVKKQVKATVIAIVFASIILIAGCRNSAEERKNITKFKETTLVKSGVYYNFLVVEIDGVDWLLDDSEESPYLKNGKAIFEDGQEVYVIFDDGGAIIEVH